MPRPVDLTDILASLNHGVNDDVAYDPSEVLNVLFPSAETMKLTPSATFTTSTQTSFVWGPFGSNTGAWGKQQYS